MKYLTTGEFARFCGTSKDTLIFYDRQNILKPRHVSSNGYRRYLPEQFYEFDFISILKESGSSLTEIREKMRQRSPEQILALLEEKKHILKKESERLAARRAILDEMYCVIAEASRIKHDSLSFEELDEEELEIIETEAEFDMDSDDGFLAKYRNYAIRLNEMPRPVFGGILISGQYLSAKRYVASGFFHKPCGSTPEKELHILAAGRYAVLTHKGNISSHIKAYRDMLGKIERCRLKMVSPMYMFDLMSYVILHNPGEYVAKYAVRVE